VNTGNTQGAKNAWRQTVARVVKSEMSVRGVKYQALSQRLEEIGVEQSADNLRNKVNKGLQILYVLKARPLDAALLEEILTDLQQ
jgi:hypothetical protein